MYQLVRIMHPLTNQEDQVAMDADTTPPDGINVNTTEHTTRDKTETGMTTDKNIHYQ